MARFTNLSLLFLGYNCIITKMCRDYVNEITEFSCKHVHIKNKENLNSLINRLVEGGARQLQVVSDFDKTITKQHENGKQHLSSFGIFGHCKSIPAEYVRKEKERTAKYHPIELDPNMSVEEKIVHMEKWWIESEKELNGLTVSRREIEETVAKLGPSLRDGSTELFEMLGKNNVPILVFSAGLGDTVEVVLKHFNVLLPNVKVISNFLQYDDNGVIKGFQHQLIHVYNKNEFALKNTKYYEIIKSRGNVILMGDSIGDAGMTDGVPCSNAVLKIGFLYEHKEENLSKYMDTFDIVLEDDQTMNVVNAILKQILI